MKKITIDELMPFLKKGWVAMDEDGTWLWFSKKPKIGNHVWLWEGVIRFLDMCKLKKENDWKDSLRKVK